MKIFGNLFRVTHCRSQENNSDSETHHFISINPLNTALLQQAGLTYEYKTRKMGFGISSGYMNDSRMNFNRVFIAGSVNHGALEFYSGYFFNPQFNFYLKEFRSVEKSTLYYLGLKGVYKNMFIDSVDYHIWDTNTGGDYYWVYRKQVDKLKVMGAFIVFGVRQVKKPFFIDLNMGSGMLYHNHNIILAASQANSGTFIENPLRKENFTEKHLTINISINLGVAF